MEVGERCGGSAPRENVGAEISAPRKKEENVRKLNPKRDVEVQRENGGIIETRKEAEKRKR